MVFRIPCSPITAYQSYRLELHPYRRFAIVLWYPYPSISGFPFSRRSNDVRRGRRRFFLPTLCIRYRWGHRLHRRYHLRHEYNGISRILFVRPNHNRSKRNANNQHSRFRWFPLLAPWDSFGLYSDDYSHCNQEEKGKKRVNRTQRIGTW